MTRPPSSHRPDPRDVRGIDLPTAQELDRDLGDIDWTALPPGVTRQDFSAPSGALAGLVVGVTTAPRFVLVPGVTGSKEDFALVLPLLAASGFQACSYDLAGQYESWAAGPHNLDPARPRYDYDLFVADLVAVIRAGTMPVHLVGYSFAGTVAQLVAAAHPELVASITLVSTPPLAGQSFRGVKVLGPLSGLASERTGAALMTWGVRNNLNGAPEHRVRFVRERFRLTRRESVSDVIGLMQRTPDLDAQIAHLPVPRLVVAGDHDLWPIALHRAFAARIGAELFVTSGGHSPSEDSPVELTRVLVDLADRAAG